MKYNLHSEHIRQRLFWSMVIIIGSIFLISVPLTIGSYQAYKKSEIALSEISVLRDITALSNKISKERAPANKAMSSTPDELSKNLADLKKYRKEVDEQIQTTIHILNKKGFNKTSNELRKNLEKSLTEGRKAVDQYIQLSPSQRTATQLDNAIKKMFVAWDSTRFILQSIVVQSIGKKTDIFNNYMLILLLADLRDQAGRVASNIMAAVTFQERIPDENIARSLQTQHQAYYLWEMINTLQPEQFKTKEYLNLHQKVKDEFFNKGIPIVTNLIYESQQKKPFSLTGTALTEAMVEKFSTVVNLQSYLLDNSMPSMQREYRKAFHQFIFSVLVSCISLITALFTLIYARNHIFIPLIEARQTILTLAHLKGDEVNQQDDSISLFEAIQKLQSRLQQRDVLEFQLHNIANTDALTNVSNRLALEKYVQILESHPEKLLHTGLIVLDIDDFKKVNDSSGHIVGDQVIQFVANKLKSNLRSLDLIARYGGDEFVIILDSIEPKDIMLVAEKIRRDIYESEFVVPETQEIMKVSISVGFAVGAMTWKELFERADRSLFRVKATGKNAVSG